MQKLTPFLWFDGNADEVGEEGAGRGVRPGVGASAGELQTRSGTAGVGNVSR